MSSIAPTVPVEVRPDVRPDVRPRAAPAAVPGPPRTGRTRRWLRRKAVVAVMNVEVAVVAGLTVLTAGVLGDRPWPE